MRGFVLLLIGVLSLLTSFAQQECASQMYLQESLRSQAVVQSIRDIELFISNRLYNNKLRMSPAGVTGSVLSAIRIPIVVHVIYNTEEQKITEEQIRSQVEVLNKDFRKLNSDAVSLPDPFKILAADCFIEFNLCTVDPRGNPTSGIVWKKTNKNSFGSDDQIKFSKSGGDDAWDAGRYLNIWVSKLSAGMVGYSSPPGCAKEKDGIVLRFTAMGTVGTVTPPYNLGRTAVHEIGHWLGLKHIWGDRYCGDDLVADTPPQKGPTPGCPSGIIPSCSNNEAGSMYMNYMDVTHDACTNMFTPGQRERMRALFEDGGPRHSFVTQQRSTGSNIPVHVELPVDSSTVTSIQIFPNPATNMITITTDNRIGERINIYNHLGQMVAQSYVTSNSTKVFIGNLPGGIYFLRLGNKRAYKFIKGSFS